MSAPVVAMKGWNAQRTSVWGAVLLTAHVLSLTACSKKLERPAPPTFPVAGKVASTGGRLPVGGCVEFKPNHNEFEFTAMGVVDAEGNFSLKIPFVDRVLPGAIEGPHSVRIILPLGGHGWSGGFVPIEGTFTVQPSENHFTITMPNK